MRHGVAGVAPAGMSTLRTSTSGGSASANIAWANWRVKCIAAAKSTCSEGL